jgi:hypothetical protein
MTKKSKYITPSPINKLTQPPQKIFDIWSFIIGILSVIGGWLWLNVIRLLF